MPIKLLIKSMTLCLTLSVKIYCVTFALETFIERTLQLIEIHARYIFLSKALPSPMNNPKL